MEMQKVQPVASAGFFIRVSDREKEMHQWIQFLVMRNLPVSFVDCPYTRNIVKLKPVSARSVQTHILSLHSVVREAICKLLPLKFVIMFDGWSDGTQHYIAAAASFTRIVNGKEEAQQTMLSMAPLLSGGIHGMRAKDHLDHLSKVLRIYGRDCCDILCLVGDNCSVNQSMARTLNIPLLGCASHKFNLAVRRWIAGQPDLVAILDKVRNAADDSPCNNKIASNSFLALALCRLVKL